MSDFKGVRFRGDWSPRGYYLVGDMVKHYRTFSSVVPAVYTSDINTVSRGANHNEPPDKSHNWRCPMASPGILNVSDFANKALKYGAEEVILDIDKQMIPDSGDVRARAYNLPPRFQYFSRLTVFMAPYTFKNISTLEFTISNDKNWVGLRITPPVVNSSLYTMLESYTLELNSLRALFNDNLLYLEDSHRLQLYNLCLSVFKIKDTAQGLVLYNVKEYVSDIIAGSKVSNLHPHSIGYSQTVRSSNRPFY